MKTQSSVLSSSGPLRFLSSLLEHGDYRFRKDPDYFAEDLEAYASPLDFENMEKGVKMARRVIESGGRIFIAGDRDVDGVSSTALMGRFLTEKLQCPFDLVHLRVSDAGEEYGLNEQMIQEVYEWKPSLVIILDMGSSQGKEIQEILQKGISVIILDHHEPGEQSPPQNQDEIAFINPLLHRDRFDHDGRTPTVALVLKFMVAYVMQFTREWNTIRSIEHRNENDETCISVYRMGSYQKSFPPQELPGEMSQAQENNEAFVPDSLECVFANQKDRLEILRKDPKKAGKWIFAFLVQTRPKLRELISDYSDMVALGLISDMMPLVSENRLIARLGMGYMKGVTGAHGRGFTPGISRLIQSMKLPSTTLSSKDIGWSISPILNAAGRMGNTTLALQLLFTSDPDRSLELSKELLRMNRQRKSRTTRNEKIVEKLIERRPELLQKKILFVYHPDLLPGVSGIVATRLMETYNRPVVYINPDGPIARGSVRGGQGSNVLEMIKQGSDLLLQYGGHRQAAGFSVDYEQIENLQTFLYEWTDEEKNTIDLFSETGRSHQAKLDETSYHIEVQPEDIHAGLMREIELLEPFGPENPEVIFSLRNVEVTEQKLMSEGQHVEFRLRRGYPAVRVIAWRMGQDFLEIIKRTNRFHLTGNLEWNHFLGKKELQFRIIDLLPAISEDPEPGTGPVDGSTESRFSVNSLNSDGKTLSIYQDQE